MGTGAHAARRQPCFWCALAKTCTGENLHWRKPALSPYPGTIPWYSIRYPGIMCMMSGHGRAPACLPVPAAAEAVPLPRRGIVLWESLRRTLVDLLRGVSRPNNGEVRGAVFRPPFFLVMCALCGRLRPSAASLHPLMLRLRYLYVSGWRRHACVWTVMRGDRCRCRRKLLLPSWPL